MPKKQGAAGLEEIICCAIWMSFCLRSELSFLPRQWMTRLMLWDQSLPGSQMEGPITATHRFITIWKPFKQEMEQKHKVWPDPIPESFFPASDFSGSFCLLFLLCSFLETTEPGSLAAIFCKTHANTFYNTISDLVSFQLSCSWSILYTLYIV